MIPSTVKGWWQVTAGVIPGHVRSEYTRQFFYSIEAEQGDRQQPRAANEPTRFEETMQAALDYARGLMDPGVLNWVRVEWIWL